MRWTRETVDYVYDKTGGYCEYCQKRLSRLNYGSYTGKGGWHIDHSRSQANGGTHYLRNLFPACWTCNIEKGARNGKSYRASMERHGYRERETDWGPLIGLGLAGLAVAAVFRKRGPPSPLVAQPWDYYKPPGWP